MLLSIIIPIYNAGSNLNRLLDSLICKEDGYEIILVNDGSTDESGGICKRYAEKFPIIKYIEQENSGVSAARNCGIEESTGKYLLFIDADDRVNGLTTRVLNILGDKEYALLEYGYNVLRDNEVINESIPDMTRTSSIDEIKADFVRYADSPMYNNVWNNIFRRDVIDGNNIRFNNMKIGEDCCFVCDYLRSCSGNYRFVEDVLYTYVEDGMSATNSFCRERWENELTLIKNLETCMTEFKIHGKSRYEFREKKRIKACLYEIENIVRVKDKKNSNLVKKRFREMHDYIHDMNKKYFTGISKKQKVLLFCIRYNIPLVMYLYIGYRQNKLRENTFD